MGYSRHKKSVLLIWFLIAGLLIVFLTAQLKVVSELKQFMPSAEQDPQLQALMNEIQKGPSATILMIRVSSDLGAELRPELPPGSPASSPINLAKLSKELRRKLEMKSDVFRYVENGEKNNEIDVFASLFPYRYLLSEKIDWSSKDLHENFKQRLSELRAGAGALLDDTLEMDPQLVFIKYLGNLVNSAEIKIQDDVWFDKQGKGVLLVAKVRSEALELDMMQRAIAEIKTAFNDISGLSLVQLEIAGPGKMAVETRSAIENVMQNMSYFITALLVIVFWVGYRSLSSIWLIGLPLLSAVLVSLAITQTVFGQVHSIVLVFGITLLGVCLDYPLHFFSHLRHGETPLISLKRVWPILKLSALSSVLAFLALLGSGFEGLSQLAIFSASGLLVALGVTRYLLPFWVFSDQMNPRLWKIDFALGLKQKRLISLLLLSLPIFQISQQQTFWETSIHAISPIPALEREKDRVLRNELNIPEISHVFLVSAAEANEALRASEKIHQTLIKAQKLGIINRIWSPSQVLPSIQTQKQRRLSLPSEQQLTQAVKKALEKLPFRTDAFIPWVQSVSSSRNLTPLSYQDIISTPLADILQQGLFKYNSQWFAVVRIGGIRSESELSLWLNAKPELRKNHLRVKQATEHLLDEYRKATFNRLIAILVLLVFIILVKFRSFSQTAFIFLPVSIGLLFGIATPLLFGFSINVFHLLALLLVLGMGLDYSLFFNKTENSGLSQQQNLHAISISALTTSASFLVLVFSSVPILVGMGQVVSSGILVCFLSSWILSSPENANGKKRSV